MREDCIFLSVLLPDGKKGQQTTNVLTRSGLTQGTCNITPDQGKVLETHHVVNCTGFVDPSGNNLLYSVRIKSKYGLGRDDMFHAGLISLIFYVVWRNISLGSGQIVIPIGIEHGCIHMLYQLG
jgi:hypothetical protein